MGKNFKIQNKNTACNYALSMDWRGSTPRKRATNPEDKYAVAIKKCQGTP